MYRACLESLHQGETEATFIQREAFLSTFTDAFTLLKRAEEKEISGNKTILEARMKYVLGKLFFIYQLLLFFSFTFKRNNLFLRVSVLLASNEYATLSSLRFFSICIFLRGAKTKICSMFVVSRILAFFSLLDALRLALFIGSHSFIIYHGNWDGNNFMLGGGRYWQIWSAINRFRSVMLFYVYVSMLVHTHTHTHHTLASRELLK